MLLFLTLRFSSPAAGGAEVSDGGGAPPGQHVEPGGAGELPVAAVHAAPSAQPLFGPSERKIYYKVPHSHNNKSIFPVVNPSRNSIYKYS